MSSSLDIEPDCTGFEILVDKDSSMPLHLQIADKLSQHMLRCRMPSNTPLPSERKFAEQLGVSRGTIRKAYECLVSRSMAEQSAIGKGGLVVSRQINERHRALSFPAIGLVPPLTLASYIDRKAYTTLDYLSSIIDTASELGFSTIFLSLPPADEPKEKVQAWWDRIREKISGLLYLGDRGIINDPAFGILASEHHIPQVCLAGSFDEPHMASVIADYSVGIFAACEHLYDLGHRRVSWFQGKAGNIDIAGRLYRYANVQKRRVFLQQSLSRLGIPSDDGAVLDLSNPYRPLDSNDEANLADTLKRLMGRPEPPTAFMCYSDYLAISVVSILKTLGWRVPEDVSVIGYDDTILADQYSPPLTAIKVPRRLVGREAVRLVADAFEDFVLPGGKQITVPTSLVIRSTTGPARSG